MSYCRKAKYIETAVRAGTQIPKCMRSLEKTKIDRKGCLMTL